MRDAISLKTVATDAILNLLFQVRTRDRTFNSVSHLINYHMENGLPIISQESELILKNPVVHAAC